MPTLKQLINDDNQIDNDDQGEEGDGQAGAKG
jgi:hypothetical protein